MIYTIIPGGLILKYDIYQVLGFGMFLAGLPWGAVVQPWNYGVVWDAGTRGALAGVVVVGTAIAFGLYLQGVSMIGPFKGSIMGSVEPVSAWWSYPCSGWEPGLRCLDFLGFALILELCSCLPLHTADSLAYG